MKNPFIVHESNIVGFQGICGWVKELLEPNFCDISNLNLTLITVDPGKTSEAHYHRQIEEVYYILSGEGEIRIDSYKEKVRAGHAIYIPNGKTHTIKNTYKEPLIILAINAPPYDPEDVCIVNNF